MGLIKFFSPVMYWIFSICLLHNDCRQLDGYKFPVNTTPFCPRNETEWNERSFAMNCTESNGYTCLPNQDLTELLEFCYLHPFIWIQDGVCLYLLKGVSRVNAYDCHHFRYGCHNSSFPSNKIFEHPACISIGNGCFLAEESCESSKTTTYLPETTEDVQKDHNISNHENNWVWIVTLLGVALLVCIPVMCTLYRYRKQRHQTVSNCNAIKEPLIAIEYLHGTELLAELPPDDKRKSSINHEKEEIEPLLDNGLDTVECIKEDLSSLTFDPSSVTIDPSFVTVDPSSVTFALSSVTCDPSSVNLDPSSDNTNKDSIDKESPLDKAIFDQWQQNDIFFIQTKACEESKSRARL